MRELKTVIAVIGCLVCSATQAGAANIVQPVTGVDGFATYDTGDLHAVVATTNNHVDDITWKAGGTPLVTTLTVYGQPIIGVAGYYSPNDHNRHAIVALNDNTVEEIWYDRYLNPHRSRIALINTYYGRITSVSGHVDHSSYQHVAIGTNLGYVILLRWYSGQGINSWVMNSGGPIPVADVASLVDDNGVNHVVTLLNKSNNHVTWHDISWTTPGAFTEIDLYPYGGGLSGQITGGTGALNWLNNTFDIAFELGSGSDESDFRVSNGQFAGVYTDMTNPWGSVATGAFYEANGWCPNRHFLLYTSANALIDYSDNACYPGWSAKTLGYNFNF